MAQNDRNNMKRALIVGGSGGIGAALADTLSKRGMEVISLSRSQDGLDITRQHSVDRAMGNLQGHFDLILVTTGILAPAGCGPEKSLNEISAAAMAQVFAVNAIGPALVLRHVPKLLPRNRPSVVAVLTARVGSIADNHLGGWYSYRASKAAANQIVRTASVELKRKAPQSAVIALHPGTVATSFTRNYPSHRKDSPEVSAQNLLQVIDGVTPTDSGRFFDWSGKEVAW
jgi:NAD(P)-dependent dehydrogenase (short-subunit alcohol dehydrogenase family)